MIDFMKEAMKSRHSSLEQAVQRFYDCGVSLDRMEIQEHRERPLESVLCVDGIPRFTWRLVYPDDLGQPTR